MRLDGRRESQNVEDRRGMSTATKAGIGGLGGIIMIALFTLLGGNAREADVGLAAGAVGQFARDDGGDAHDRPEL